MTGVSLLSRLYLLDGPMCWSLIDFHCLKQLDAFGQGVFPIRDFQVVGLLDFCLVEHTVRRPPRRGGVFFGVQGPDVAVFDACKPVDDFGKVVP